jgi:hypothetical protein
MGCNRSKEKTLTMTLADNKVTGFNYSGGGNETRGTAQSTPKTDQPKSSAQTQKGTAP